METTHKNFIDLIYRFLDDKYYLKDSKFFTKYNDIHEWGWQIAELIEGTFSISRESSKEILKNWYPKNYLSEKDFVSAWGSKKLKAVYSVDAIRDLQAYAIDAEAEIIRLLSEEVSKEIDGRILSDLNNEIKTLDEFEGILKCVGYVKSPLVYDPNTFAPLHYLVQNTHNEMMNERQNNQLYQRWLSEQ